MIITYYNKVKFISISIKIKANYMKNKTKQLKMNNKIIFTIKN